MVMDIKNIGKMINAILPILNRLGTVLLYFFVYCDANVDRPSICLGGRFVLF